MAASMMLKGGLAALPVQRKSVRSAAVKQQETRTSAATSSVDEIYIGFPKGDYARPPGRKGRTIRDDPRKYPGREDLGFFQGAVGGWAGGEEGLWKLREQVEKDKSKQGPPAPVRGPASPLRKPTTNRWGVKQASASGRDPIYVGFGKDELDLKKSGIQGRVIYDETYKYPDREDLVGLKGVVGGFAGGEAALRSFVETGELRLRKPGDPLVRKQFSPLTVAFVMFFAASTVGVLLAAAQHVIEQ